MKNIFRDWILRFEEKGEFSLEPVKLWGFMPFFFLMAIPEKSSRVKVQGAKVPLPLKFISSKLEKKNEEKYGGFSAFYGWVSMNLIELSSWCCYRYKTKRENTGNQQQHVYFLAACLARFFDALDWSS